MDDKTLASLRAALAASPENHELRMVLLGALLDRDETSSAHDLVSRLEPGDVESPEHRLLAGRACLAATVLALVVSFLTGSL